MRKVTTYLFDEDGEYTLDPLAVRVEVLLAGGGGGGGSAPGGQGGRILATFEGENLERLQQPVPVTIGLGGQSRQPGGNTSFGTLATAYGGGAGGGPDEGDIGGNGVAQISEYF